MDLRFASFAEAAEHVLSYLQQHFDFDLWMVTRTAEEDWIVLYAVDNGYNVGAGDSFKWADSFCSRMVRGEGPRVAPRSEEIAVYKSALIGQQVPIKSYIGMPLYTDSGEVFGTLCAIDPETQNDKILEQQDLLELMVSLLNTILIAELRSIDRERRVKMLEDQALMDGLTSVLNRRGWDLAVERENSRARQFGVPSGVVIIDLDELKPINDTRGHEAGDALLVNTAATLGENLRDIDILARLGGDEFGILCPETTRSGLERLVARLRSTLEESGIKASIGHAFTRPGSDILETRKIADARMYDEKRAKKPTAGRSE